MGPEKQVPKKQMPGSIQSATKQGTPMSWFSQEVAIVVDVEVLVNVTDVVTVEVEDVVVVVVEVEVVVVVGKQAP